MLDSILTDIWQNNRELYPVNGVEKLMNHAFATRCSDIHIRPGSEGFSVLYRINGMFQFQAMLAEEPAQKIYGRLKVLSGLPVYKSKEPSEGRFELSGHDIRISFFPTILGENAVMRIFSSSQEIPALEHLYTTFFQETESLKETLDSAKGLILFCGPTGSGKTTSLYSCLKYLALKNSDFLSFASLEDPVERKIPGVSQSEISPETGFSFSSGLKFLLRQDINCIMIGEIRDEETARTAIQAAMTGHLILSTLHTESAADAPYRLQEMGAKPRFISLALKYIVAQRLVRLPCTCASGCDTCTNTGYSSRTAVGEFMRFSESHAETFLSSRNPAELNKHATEKGMKTLSEYARELLQRAVTSAEEIERVF